MEWREVLEIYGPLALGWPLFFIVLARLFRVHESVIDTIEKNTQVLTLLAERIRVRYDT